MESQFAACLEVRTLIALCDEVATPFSQRVLRLVERGDWKGLAELKVNPRSYTSAETYLGDAQCAALLKKLPSLPLASKTAENEAKATFWAAERQCYRTNERLGPLINDIDHYGGAIGRIIRLWRKEIKFVLGPLPSLEGGRFGPGSTFANLGDQITIADKFDGNYTTTNQAYRALHPNWDVTGWSRYAAAGLMHDPDGVSEVVTSMHDFELSPLYVSMNCSWATRDFEEIRGNRFTTVAKTALTDRGICIEASLNVWYQLNVGSLVTKRLGRAYGWSKVRIQQYHRLLARIGSRTGRNATVDLRNASDTVARALVMLGLPHAWFDLFNQLRSSHTLFEGKWVKLEKFSSMGNGYTFELETLLFFTLAKVIARETGAMEDPKVGAKVSVFGDDIIVPVECAKDLISALRFFGFEVNVDKTFTEGPFRESCGGDYFAGYDVRPHFVKKEITTPADAISLANGLHRFYDRLEAHRPGAALWWSHRRVLNSIPRQIRKCNGPAALGDLVVRNDNPLSWSMVLRGSIRYIRVWRPVVHRSIDLATHYRPGVVMATALYLAGTRKTTITEKTLAASAGKLVAGFEMTPRIGGSYISGYRFGRVPYS